MLFQHFQSKYRLLGLGMYRLLVLAEMRKGVESGGDIEVLRIFTDNASRTGDIF